MSRYVMDITAAQADIVKFTVRQFAQRIAGHATIIPDIQRIETIGKKLNKTVSGDSAQRCRAGRVGGGHGGYPFLKLLIAWAHLPDGRRIILLHVQSKPGRWQGSLARIA